MTSPTCSGCDCPPGRGDKTCRHCARQCDHFLASKTIAPPVRLRIVCDGRPWALRVETEDGRLVDNVVALRVDWGSRDPNQREGQPTVTLTIANVSLDLAAIAPGYVRVELPEAEPDCLCRHAIAQTPGQPTRHDRRCSLAPTAVSAHAFVEDHVYLDSCAYKLPPYDDSDYRRCGRSRSDHVG